MPFILASALRGAFRIAIALRLNRIFLRFVFFHIHCNNFKKCLSERSYSEKLIHKEILKARSQSRDTLLDKGKMSRKMTELLLILRTIRSLKASETFQKSCIFYLHQISSIGQFLQIFPEQVLKTVKVSRIIL